MTAVLTLAESWNCSQAEGVGLACVSLRFYLPWCCGAWVLHPLVAQPAALALLCSGDSSPARSVLLMGTCGVSDLLLMNKAAATIHTRVLGQALTR